MHSHTDGLPVAYHLQRSRTRPQLTRCEGTWGELAALLAHGHQERDDKDGPGVVLAEMSKPYRAAANVARFDAVLMDMDSHGDTQPPHPEDAADMLAAAGLAGVIYTTHSHTDDAPRYRVVVPLAEPIPPAGLERATRAAAAAIGLDCPALDPKSWVVGQFFYLPSCRPDAPRFLASLDGAAFVPPAAEVLALPVAADAPPALAAPAAAPYAAPRRAQPQGSVIDAYDAAHRITDTLARYGYKQMGERWLSPRSTSGAPGVTVFERDNCCFIHHSSDPLYGGDGGQPRGPFDFFQEFEHGGDIRAATRAAAELLGMRRERAAPAAVAPAARAAADAPEWVDSETGEIHGGDEAPSIEPPIPRELPAPMDVFSEMVAPPIDLECLPPVIARYAAEHGELIGIDPSMIAIPALVACAAALHDWVQIQPKRHETGWRESARLWCAVVGAPSVRKTPAISRAIKRLRKIDRDLAVEGDAATAAHAEQLEAHKDAKREAKKTGERVGAPPEAPPKRRMLVEDITVEALADVLKDNTRGVLCTSDELSGWFGSMDAYSGGKAGNKDRAAWLQAYNGGHRQVDRVHRGSVNIENFGVSMIGGIQPDAIRRIAKDMTDDGLMQRFMVIIGRNAREYDRPEDTEASILYARLVDSLHGVSPAAAAVTLSDGAHEIRARLKDYADELVEYKPLPSGLRSHLGKWSGLFARLLLVYHACECVERGVHPVTVQVHADTAAQVDALMRRFLLPHALAYYSDVIGQASDLEHVRWIAGHVLARGLEMVTNRDLTRAYKAWRGMDAWSRKRVMQTLDDMGWITPIRGDGASRQDPCAWAVDGRVHAMFAEKALAEAERREQIRGEVAAMQRGG